MTECLRLKHGDEASPVVTFPGTGSMCTRGRLFTPKAYVRNVRDCAVLSTYGHRAGPPALGGSISISLLRFFYIEASYYAMASIFHPTTYSSYLSGLSIGCLDFIEGRRDASRALHA